MFQCFFTLTLTLTLTLTQERKPVRAMDLLRAAKKRGCLEADWLLAKLEAKSEVVRFWDDKALRSCFEGDHCGRALSMLAWFSKAKKNLGMLQQSAELGDAFGQFLLGVFLHRDGKKKDAAKWMQCAVAQGFPDAIGHFVFNADFRYGSNLSDELVCDLCKHGASLGSGPCLEIMEEQAHEFRERIEWLVKLAIRKGSMSQALREASAEALEAFGESRALESHLLFLYICGREFEGYEELYQTLRENITYSSHQKYVVPMISFYVHITHLARCAAIHSILCLKGFVQKDCVRLIAKHVYNARFHVKVWKNLIPSFTSIPS